jgi:hypothetical protein
MHCIARGFVVCLVALACCGELERRVEGGAASAGARTARATPVDASVTDSDGGVDKPAAAADAGVTDSDGGIDKSVHPAATSFVVNNVGDSPLLLGSTCGARWLSLSDGDRELRYDTMCLCPCGGPACACPDGCVDTQQLLMPGLTSEQRWDGIARAVQPSECYDEYVPAIGTELAARACWNGVPGMVDPTCSSSTFAYGSSRSVELQVSAMAAGPHDLSLTLTNATEGPIEIATDSCGSQGWFSLTMGERFTATWGCPCTCTTDHQRDFCPSCGACGASKTKVLAPGESTTLHWDGQFFYKYESDCVAS